MKPKPSITFEALGTEWMIEAIDVARQQTNIKNELDRIDHIWSRFQDDSLISLMAKEAGTYELDQSDALLMKWYQQLYEATDGLVSPLIGQALVDAGYDQAYSLKPKTIVHSSPTWEDTLVIGIDSITIKQPALIDVGAAGKGYAVDQVARLLDGDYCVDASGDILVHGQEMRIGLQSPHDETQLIGVATIKNESICGSAITRRAWGDWHHIINPKTAKPVDDIIATWVIADNAMHADGLATALFFVSPEKLNQLTQFEYCIIYRNGTVKSVGQKIELFTEKATK
ncbi:MAG: ApbE-like protein thiamine biosynthesis lipoprotein [Candidatus Saccharibacteria bacterium]|nr:ApbE-like protein thiamine biosynthesis lipoprotein [Candidatus Saccharibacteria bacterium]